MGPATNCTSTYAAKYRTSASETKSATATIHIVANTTNGGSFKNRT
jgi:hypothetical protein